MDYIDCIEINDSYIELIISLYSIYYPNEHKVKIKFVNVFNKERVHRYFQSILDDSEPNGEIGCRIQTLHFDEKKESIKGNVYIFINTDWEGSLRIHCKEFSEHDYEIHS